jgi:hypothetical protein
LYLFQSQFFFNQNLHFSKPHLTVLSKKEKYFVKKKKNKEKKKPNQENRKIGDHNWL